MAEIDWKVLFSRVQEGDNNAFERLYEELKQPVFTICWRILQSKELAEDITHDVFVKLFVSPPGASVTNPRAWVFTMAHNLAVDSLRRMNYRVYEEVQPGYDDYTQIDIRIDLEAAMSKLPWVEREILTFHLNVGLKFSEISRIIHLSLPATYRRYRKALKTLQSELNGGNL